MLEKEMPCTWFFCSQQYVHDEANSCQAYHSKRCEIWLQAMLTSTLSKLTMAGEFACWSTCNKPFPFESYGFIGELDQILTNIIVMFYHMPTECGLLIPRNRGTIYNSIFLLAEQPVKESG